MQKFEVSSACRWNQLVRLCFFGFCEKGPFSNLKLYCMQNCLTAVYVVLYFKALPFLRPATRTTSRTGFHRQSSGKISIAAKLFRGLFGYLRGSCWTFAHLLRPVLQRTSPKKYLPGTSGTWYTSAKYCDCCVRVFSYTKWKTSSVSTSDGWLKLDFASCVIPQTRSFGVLVLCFGVSELHLRHCCGYSVPQVVW